MAAGDEQPVTNDRFSRIFDILELLAGSTEGMTVTQVGKHLGLPISSTHNVLQRMVQSDVATVTDGPRYLVGARAVRLGIRVVEGLQVRLLARRHLEELARETGEDVYLAVRHGRRVVYVDRIHGRRPVTVEIRLGQSLFLHATAVGKLFAAHERQLRLRLFREPRSRLTDQTLTEPDQLEAELDRILQDGFSVSREEAIEGIVGLAVPVLDADDNLVAAIHISALRSQIDRKRERELVKMATVTAAAIGADLGRVPMLERGDDVPRRNGSQGPAVVRELRKGQKRS